MKKSDYYTTAETMRILEVTRATLNKWVLQGKIGMEQETQGFVVYNLYNKEEVQSIKRQMGKKRKVGIPLFD